MQVSQRECRWLKERMGKVKRKCHNDDDKDEEERKISFKRITCHFFCQWHLLMISCAVLSTTRSTRIFVDDFRYVLNLNAFNSITDDQFSNHTHYDERLHYTALNALKMSQTYCVHSNWLPIEIDRLQVICIQVHDLNGGWCHCLLLIYPFIHVMCFVHLFAFSYFYIAVVHITFRFCFSTALPATHDYIFAERERCANYSNLFT